jgi:hypothetical protein
MEMGRKSRAAWLTVGTLLVMLAISGWAEAIEYYVDQNHPSASDQNPGTVDRPWKTFAKANSTLVAGDVVYVKQGTYNSYIAPANSGSYSNRITYRNFGADTVTVQNASYGINLDGKSYVTVHGFNFYNLDRFMFLQNGANYNIIAYCNFDQMRTRVSWAGSRIIGSSSHNWVHHCRFSKYGVCSGTPPGGEDSSVVFEIGDEESPSDYSDYNLIEENTMYHGGHHVLGVAGRYNTVRNNYLYNDGWSQARGNRSLYLGGYSTDSSWNLIEGNSIGYTEASCDSTLTSATLIDSGHNIFRFNRFFYNNQAGLQFSVSSTYYQDIVFNHVYNNTFFNNALGNAYEADPGNAAVYLAKWSGTLIVKYNIFKNNLYYKHPKVYGTYGGPNFADQIFANEFNGDVSGDPKFVNASSSLGDPSEATYPNLNLKADSPAIDKGGPLTTVGSGDVGSGVSLVVADAGYFQDGTWAPAGTVEPDWIAVGSVTKVVQISAVNYSTNTITLASGINRNVGDSVWLYKKSDGKLVLYGSAPDAGAYEFIPAVAPEAPKNLRLLE